ncbi:NUDIX hydrolase [Bifidobacterium sp. B4001]|uniref:NUDIX domain-containing protein n=1 Tax=Bifidobacterium TaxID=1678 RepID=UPI001C69D097|nr:MULTISPECIES: NUDIX hydrolase [Bifidobacterium]MCX8672194.1 NUDIX hydrolase [Bifidobacterium sp. B4079]MCX8680628.1 NUDIX hydrolase [Bifidobacterium sp. B4001]QYN61316.1 NUDIX hydrolase [Bifidobacterium asteroides]
MTTQIYRRFDPWRTSPVQEKARKQIMDSHYFSVDRVTFESSDNQIFDRSIVSEKHGDTIAVLAITDDGRMPLVEQYRLPIHRWTLELPAGHPLNDKEAPIDVATRRLREEAGYKAASLNQFARFINTPSFSTQHTTLFYAQGLTPVQPTSLAPETPHQNVRLFTVDEAYDMVIAGTILDAKTTIAILRAKIGLSDLH